MSSKSTSSYSQFAKGQVVTYSWRIFRCCWSSSSLVFLPKMELARSMLKRENESFLSGRAKSGWRRDGNEPERRFAPGPGEEMHSGTDPGGQCRFVPDSRGVSRCSGEWHHPGYLVAAPGCARR